MKHRPHRVVLYYLLRCAIFVIQCLPRQWGLALGRFIGWVVYVLVPRHRRKALEHLRIAFGSEKTENQLRRIARLVFENLAFTLVDVIYFPTWNWEKVNTLVDRSQMERIAGYVRTQGGVIVITGHIGNWELLAALYAINGFDGAAVARRLRYEKVDELLVQARASLAVRTIYRDESPKRILKVLKEGGILGMLADQDVDSVDGLFVDFFGRPAYTPVAPARIALAAGVPIIPAFVIREKNRYRLYVEDPIEPDPAGDKQQEVERLTRAWSDVVEQYVRRFPEQWVWMHPRWKTQSKEVVAC